MSNETYIDRSLEVAARRIGDELMIMSARDSSLFSLNETAALLWEAADGRTPLREIVEQRLCSEFAVEFDVALADAEAVVQELAGHGILKVSGEPAPAATDGTP